jgi:Na+-transporting NADH:ubiquinone oxidoreductase subunit B
MLMVSYAVGLFWELLFASVRGHNISEGFLVTGLLFPMTLPPTTPLWQVAVGISFGVVIGKEIFGGTGRNILNPALTARAFLFFAYPANMSGDRVWTLVQQTGRQAVDAVTAATPLALLPLSASGEAASRILNDAGYTFGRLFIGNLPGSVGETSALMCLLGAGFLVLTGVGNYRIMAGGILGVLAVAYPGYLINLSSGGEAARMFSVHPLWHLVMGSFAFGIVYMATDPVSGPGMNLSRWLYGFAIGALTVTIRVFNPAYPEGVMLAILFMNLFAPLMDHFVIKARLRKRVTNV